MERLKLCEAQVFAVNDFGEGVASLHCDYNEDLEDKKCAFAKLAEKGHKVVTSQNSSCMRGYEDNFPELPSKN